MEFLKSFRRRSFLSELVYIGLNVCLAVAILLIVRTVDSIVPALLLVILSKWRVFAVRPRYWLANIQANFVDFTVSVSTVIVLYSVGSNNQYSLLLQGILTLLYIAWLIYLKPRSSKRAVIMQAGVALIIGPAALFTSSYNWPIEVLVLCMAVVGYVVGRHVLTQYEEDHLQFLSLFYAFVLAQLGWIFYHWVVAYSLPVVGARVPQAVLLITVISFVIYKVYDSYKMHDQVRPVDIVLPVLFGTSIVAVLLLFFSAIPIGAL